VAEFAKHLKLSGVNFDKSLIDEFIQKHTRPRILNISGDIIFKLLDYMSFGDLLCLLTCCTRFKYLLPKFWVEWKCEYFPKNLIPITIDDYTTFVLNASLAYYHWYKIDYSCCVDGNYLFNLDRCGYESKTFEFLKTYEFNSVPYDRSLTYLEKKPKMDMRLYGFNPKIRDDVRRWGVLRKWLTGEHNIENIYDSDIDLEFGDEENWSDDEFEYHRSWKVVHDECPYSSEAHKVRKMPPWVKPYLRKRMGGIGMC